MKLDGVENVDKECNGEEEAPDKHAKVPERVDVLEIRDIFQ